MLPASFRDGVTAAVMNALRSASFPAFAVVCQSTVMIPSAVAVISLVPLLRWETQRGRRRTGQPRTDRATQAGLDGPAAEGGCRHAGRRRLPRRAPGRLATPAAPGRCRIGVVRTAADPRSPPGGAGAARR